MRYIDKDLDSIQEIRNLLLNAQLSFVQLQKLTPKEFDNYCESFIHKVREGALEAITHFVVGSGYGSVEDECAYCNQFLNRFAQTHQKENFLGMVKGDEDDKVMTIGVSLGVVAVLLPSHPTYSLLVNLLLLALKSGNAMIFVANAQSKKASLEALKQLIHVVEEEGYPQGALTIAETVSDASISELLASDKVALILNIGCPQFISDRFCSNIPTLYGGEASGSVFIERTANVDKAIQNVIVSRSFNHGILPGSEQFLVTEHCIADKIKASMTNHGAYLLNQQETQQLIAFIKVSSKNLTTNYVGQSALWLAKMSGIEVPEKTKVLVSVQDYMSEEDFFNQQLLCPIIVVYCEPDWTLACGKCMSILAELRMGHTLTIHSRNWRVIKEFAMQKAVGRIVVNAPTVTAATGISTAFDPSLVLGGLTTKRGYGSENITPKHLTYIRQVGFSVEE